MTKILLIFHVLAAIIAVGPIAVAASMFPAAARKAAASAEPADDVASVRVLHRICRVYAVVGLAIPVFGFATASSLHVLGSPWLIASIIVTFIAAVVLAALILPAQAAVLTGLTVSAPGGAAPAVSADRAQTMRLAALTGMFNLLWVTVTILMIVRPGSTTGA